MRIRDCVVCNRLKPNEEKTQIIWLGTRQHLDKVTVQTLKRSNATIPFSSVVNDLVVVLDRQLTMANHVAALRRSRLFHLRRLRVIKRSLTPDATETLLHAVWAIDWATATAYCYCEPTSTAASRRLRSAHSGRLTVPRTRTNYSNRSFDVQGPRVPAALRPPDITPKTFRNKLKTFSFNA